MKKNKRKKAKNMKVGLAFWPPRRERSRTCVDVSWNRIFIHNVDSYIGRALVKELRKADGTSAPVQ